MAKKKVTVKKKAKAAPKGKAKPKKKVAKPAAAKAKAKPARKPAARPKARRAPAPAAPASLHPAVAPGARWINAMLVVRNMQGAIDFYTKGFGFQLRSTFPMPDGTLGHAELTHKDSLIMLGPESQERGSLAPTGPSPVTLYVYVENVDETTARAAGMGGNVAMPAADMFWGDRCSLVIDPEGHSWMLATHYKTMTPEEMVQAMQALPPM